MKHNIDEICFDISNSLLLKIYFALCDNESDDGDINSKIISFLIEEDFSLTNATTLAKHLVRLFTEKTSDKEMISVKNQEIDIIKKLLVCFWEDTNIEKTKDITRNLFDKLSVDNSFFDLLHFVLTEVVIYIDCNFYIELFEKHSNIIEKNKKPFFCSDILYTASFAYCECETDFSHNKAIEAINKCIQLRQNEDFEGLFHARAALHRALLMESLLDAKTEIENILTFAHIQDDRDFLAECDLELGNICCKIGILDEAMKYFQNAIDGFSNELSSDYEIYVLAYCSICEMYAKTNEVSKLYFYAKKAYEFCKKYNVQGENFVICINNFALSKFYLNDKVDLKKLLSESKIEIGKYAIESSLAGAYVYNTAAYTGNSDVFNKSSKELFEISLDIFQKFGIVENVYLLKMNNISAMLSSNYNIELIKLNLDECNNEVVVKNNRLYMQLLQLYTEYYVIADLKDCAKKTFFKCVDVSEKVSYKDVIEIIINSYKTCTKIFNMTELRLLLQKVPLWIEKRCEEIVTLKDENLILDAIYEIDKLGGIIMLMNSEGYIDYSTEEIYEIITNIKSLYVWLLKDNIQNLKSSCEGEMYISEKRARIHDDVLYLIKNQKKKEFDVKNIEVICNCSFKWTSISEVYESIPDNSLVLDYYAYLPKYVEEYNYEDMSYCLFAIKKEENIRTRVIRLNDVPCKMTQDYLRIVLGEATNSKLGNLVEVARYGARMGLYEKFVKPIEQYLENNIETIYFVPAADLCRVPFGILGVNLFQTLIDKYNLIYIDSTCYLKKTGKVDFNNKTCFIAGNPKFTLSYTDEKPTLPDGTRISTLGFSNIEAETIADKFKIKPYLKKEANKKNILNSNADILHIATHGYYFEAKDESELYEENPFYRSCIFVSGVNDWLINTNKDDNGIITASDLYYSNLCDMELVILSACSSGLGETNLAGGIIGMRTILKSLNAKFIILCLWEIDDLATAIFMNKLYDNISRYPVAKALAETQRYLKRLSIKEMRSEGWFDEINMKRSGVSRQVLIEFSRRDNKDIPFRNFRYWGGYILCV